MPGQFYKVTQRTSEYMGFQEFTISLVSNGTRFPVNGDFDIDNLPNPCKIVAEQGVKFFSTRSKELYYEDEIYEGTYFNSGGIYGNSSEENLAYYRGRQVNEPGKYFSINPFYGTPENIEVDISGVDSLEGTAAGFLG